MSHHINVRNDTYINVHNDSLDLFTVFTFIPCLYILIVMEFAVCNPGRYQLFSRHGTDRPAHAAVIPESISFQCL